MVLAASVYTNGVPACMVCSSSECYEGSRPNSDVTCRPPGSRTVYTRTCGYLCRTCTHRWWYLWHLYMIIIVCASVYHTCPSWWWPSPCRTCGSVPIIPSARARLWDRPGRHRPVVPASLEACQDSGAGTGRPGSADLDPGVAWAREARSSRGAGKHPLQPLAHSGDEFLPV